MANRAGWKPRDVLLLDVLGPAGRLLSVAILVPLAVLQTTLLTWLWVRLKLTRYPTTWRATKPPQPAAPPRGGEGRGGAARGGAGRLALKTLQSLLFVALIGPIAVAQLTTITLRWLYGIARGRPRRWGVMPGEAE